MAEQVLPLNSRRITTGQMRALAAGLELPTNASREDLAQMLCGKLTEEGRQSSNVQLVVGDRQLRLRDENGVFLEVAREDANEEPTLEAEEREGTPTPQPPEDQIREELKRVTAERDDLQARVVGQQEEIQRQKERYAQLWRMNCEQLEEFDKTLGDKEEQIKSLLDKIQQLEAGNHEHVAAVPTATTPVTTPTIEMSATNLGRRGKAPPVDQFSGNQHDLTFDDWLPTLERAAQWNAWTEEELLLQLAGHLRGRAFREWNLIRDDDRQDYNRAVKSLKERLDPGFRTLAAQDFRHTRQKESETVTDFICRLERTFQLAYGRDPMSQETRQMLLYGQLQEGLRDEMMKSSAVSGALSYSELCVAAKNEERRQAEFARRQQYRRATQNKPSTLPDHNQVHKSESSTEQKQGSNVPSTRQLRKCYTCGKTGHISRDCKSKATESRGKCQSAGKGYTARQVSTKPTPMDPDREDNPMDYLHSDSEEGEVRQITVKDQGSQTKCAKVTVQGIPMYGIIDSGADITIMGGEMFKKVATFAKLRKKDFKTADKTPYTYDGQPFNLDGRMDLEIGFADKVLRTTVYIKMNANDQLLLSEGVCHQLGILSYHPEVQVWRGRRNRHSTSATAQNRAKVPTIRVKLVHATRLLSRQSIVVQVQAGNQPADDLLFEPQVTLSGGLPVGCQTEAALISPNGQGLAHVVVTNINDFALKLAEGLDIGEASVVQVIQTQPKEPITVNQISKTMSETAEDRKAKLTAILEEEAMPLTHAEKEKLLHVLLEHHDVFALDEKERGETDLAPFKIDTGDAPARKQPARRIPFAVREEVNRQLKRMMETRVIQPSHSPWASPIVLVKKNEDGNVHPIAYASRSLSPAEKNYSITELETLAVVWAFSHYRAYVYGHKVLVYTDHSAVKAVLETPNPSGKHARWWTKVYGSGVQSVDIVHRSGKENANADALSRQPQNRTVLPEATDIEYQVSSVTAETLPTTGQEATTQEISQLLESPTENEELQEQTPSSFHEEQVKDSQVKEMMEFLTRGALPPDDVRARKIALQASLFTLIDKVLYFVDKSGGKRIVVPQHLKQQIMEECHGGHMGGHFSGNRLFSTLARRWWWERMYSDTLEFSQNCPQCAITTGTGRPQRPPSSPYSLSACFSDPWG